MSTRRRFSSNTRGLRSLRRRRTHGFTLLEILIVLAVLGIAAVLVVPNLLEELQKQRKRSFLGEANTFVLKAKQESARRGVPVVVALDLANDQLFAFANVDGDADLAYAPDNSEVSRTVDYEVARLGLPPSGTTFLLDFWAAADGSPRGTAMTEGMTLNGAGDPVFVFERDGSVRDVGAVRLGDLRENYFELRVAPAATARVQVLKYNPTTDFDGPGYLPQGFDEATGKNYWKWY